MTHAIRAFGKVLLVSLSVTALSACHIDDDADDVPAPSAGSVTVTQPGVPGGVSTNVVTVTAVVTDIDYKKRTVTLKNDLGEKRTLAVGPQAKNFANIKKGDLVTIDIAEELAVYLREKNSPETDNAAGLVATALPGQKPAMLVADTAEMTAVVTAIDLKNHTATLEFEDGSKKTVNVREDVVLNKQQIGKQVVFRLTSAIAISVDKPE